MYKFQTKNIANQLTNKILHFLKYSTEYQQIFKIDEIKSFQGKNRKLLKDMKIEFSIFKSKKSESKLIKGFYDESKNKINLYFNKNDIDSFRQKFYKNKHHIKNITFDSIEYVRREILLFFEHELTHKLQFRLIPKSYGICNYNDYSNDFREIEAVSNEIIKLKHDYNISYFSAIQHCLNKRNINRKKVLKKIYKKEMES